MSGELEGEAVDLRAVTRAEAAATAGVPHARELLVLAEAVVRGGAAERTEARRAAIAALGPEGFVAAAAVASNFERMVRIADATGIPLDPPLAALTAELRSGLGIDRFGSAANTPALPAAQRLFGRFLGPLARWALPALAGLSRRAARRRR